MNPKKAKQLKYLILDNVRSVHNVGSIFRTADAVGVDKIILVGQTPSPIDRFGRERQDLHKVALGAEKNIKWEYVESKNFVNQIEGLKSNGFNMISLEQDRKSVDYKEINKILEKEKCENGCNVAIVVGNEVDGVSREILEKSNHVVEIPMKGKKESLNVAVSTGIILYELFC